MFGNSGLAQQRPDGGHEIGGHRFRALGHAAFDPILDDIDKACGDVVQQEISGDIGISRQFLQPGGHEIADIFPEVAQKQFAALAGKHTGDVLAVFVQVPENVGHHIHRRFCTHQLVAELCHVPGADDHMVKNIGAQLPQQIILGFEMGIEGGAAHICGINNVLHCDTAVAFLGKQPVEGLENGISGFLLATIHKYLPNKCRFLFRIAQTKTIVRCARAKMLV